MSNPFQDTGIVTVMTAKLVEQRLPRLELLNAQLDRGEALTEYDFSFLEEALGDCRGYQPLFEQHPELQALASRAMHLYKEIMDKAIKNEKSKPM